MPQTKCIVLFENFSYYFPRINQLALKAMELQHQPIVILPANAPKKWTENLPYTVIANDQWDTPSLRKILHSIQSKHSIAGINTAMGCHDFRHGDLLAAQIAHIAQELGLPHNNPDALWHAHNKFLMRETLKNKGVHTVKYALIDSLASLEKQAQHIGFPLVLKPAIGAGSSFVCKCHNLETAKQAYLFYTETPESSFLDMDFQYHYQGQNFSNNQQMLMEQAIEGIELSVEVICTEEDALPVLVHEKFDVIDRKHCVDENIVVAPPFSFQQEQLDQVTHYAKEVVKALDLQNCICHVELRFDSHLNRPSIIEVNPRMGASRIQDNVKKLCGIDLMNVFIAQAVGISLPLSQPQNQDTHYAMSVIYPHEKGVLRSVTGLDQVETLPNVINTKKYYEDGALINGENEEIFLLDVWYTADSKEALLKCDKTIRQCIQYHLDPIDET